MKQKLWILVFMCCLASQLVQGSDTDSIASDTNALPVRFIEGCNFGELSEIESLDRQVYKNLVDRLVDFQYGIYNNEFSEKELESKLKNFKTLSQVQFAYDATRLVFNKKLEKVAKRHSIRFEE